MKPCGTLFYLLLLTFGVTHTALAQPAPDWATHTAGQSNDNATGVANDAAGNIYVTGKFSSLADFDPGPGQQLLQAGRPGAMYVCKYDTIGNLIWVRTVNANLSYDIYVDAFANVYTTGSFQGTVDFDPGPGVYNLNGTGLVNMFATKWDSAGNFLWATMFGTSGGGTASDNSRSITVDLNGNVFITGQHNGNYSFLAKMFSNGTLAWQHIFNSVSSSRGLAITTNQNGDVIFSGVITGLSVDFDPGPGVANLNYQNGRIFICKYNSAGALLQAWNFASGGDTEPFDMILDAQGNYIVSGYVSDDGIDFDPGPGVDTMITNYGLSPFATKFDAQGNYLWTGHIDGYGKGSKLAVDASDNIILTGYTQYNTDFDPGAGVYYLNAAFLSHGFVCKWDGSGNFISAGNIAGNKATYTNAVSIDAAGRLLIAGTYDQTADLDPGPGIESHTSIGGANIFTIRLEPDMDLLTANTVKGSSLQFGNGTVDQFGNVVVTGSFWGTLDFDPDSTVYLATAYANQKAFVRKLTPDGNFLWLVAFDSCVTSKGLSLDTDHNGNIFISGTFSGNFDADPGPGVFVLHPSPAFSSHRFVIKLDAAGSFIWAKMFENDDIVNSGISELAVDGAGNVFLCGTIEGTFDLDPGPATNTVNAVWSNDVYLLKLDVNGNFSWGFSLGGSTFDEFSTGLSVDGAGNCYFAGQFEYTFDCDPGLDTAMVLAVYVDEAFVIKYNSNGQFVWVRQLSPTAGQAGTVERTELFSNEDGDISLTGSFSGQIDFDPNAGIDTSRTAGISYPELFVSRWDSSGTYLWSTAIPYATTGSASVIDNNDKVFVVGADSYFGSGSNSYLYLAELDSFGSVLWSAEPARGNLISLGTDQFYNKYIMGEMKSKADFDFTSGVHVLNPSSEFDIFTVRYSSGVTGCSVAPTGITASIPGNVVCAGASVALTQSGGTVIQGGTYTWFVDSCGGMPIGSGAGIIVTPAVNTTYYLRTEDSCGVSGCVSITINVLPAPAPPVISGNSLFCTNSSIMLDAGSGYSTYYWSTGETTQTSVVASAGQYTVTVTSANGCSAESSLQVTTYANPPVTVSPMGYTGICQGDTLMLTAVSLPGVSFQWYRNGAVLPGAVNDTYGAYTAGRYTCKVSDGNTCDSISLIKTVRIICLPPLDEELKLNGDGTNQMMLQAVYDYRANALMVSAMNLTGQSWQLQLADVIGRMVMTSAGTVVSGTMETRLDVLQLPGGIYFLMLTDGMQTGSRKIAVYR